MDPATAFSGAFGVVFGIAAIFLLLALYFLPAIIAYKRNHHNRLAILMVDLLVGWSFLGWAVALVWACTAVKRTSVEYIAP
jgi:amino acid transporter